MAMADNDGVAAGGASAPEKPQATKRVDQHPPGPANQSGGDLHTYIGARLRQAFDDIANQPVPDRFLQLMQELDKT